MILAPNSSKEWEKSGPGQVININEVGIPRLCDNAMTLLGSNSPETMILTIMSLALREVHTGELTRSIVISGNDSSRTTTNQH